MPRFRQTAEILRLMRDKERIRNVGVIAHIDHGKTTMTDSLLVEAGLLPAQLAGSARVLDYLEEEQRRGITIKTANISLLHEVDGSAYVINLVDTPGHVDFTGKVARALRAIDGAIVVVDAVEEVMAQTETVMRQALEERVRPVLFVNKVDRLIRQLRLSPREIQEKFSRIINDFNNIIEIHCEPEFKRKWKADAAKDSVVFGSALDKWGFTFEIAKEKKTTFKDRTIWKAYENGTVDSLSKAIPLQTAILDMVVKHVPNPVESQSYRVSKIWKGKPDSIVGRAMENCDDKGPLAMCITAVQTIPAEGVVATGRVFSGSVTSGKEVYLVDSRAKCKVSKVSIYMGAFREAVNQISAGSIAAVGGLEPARVGETVVDAEHGKDMDAFKSIRYFSEPVMTVAVEPKNPRDLVRMLEVLDGLSLEDPNLRATVDKETGQYLLSGMGELHLEVTINLLKQKLGETLLNVSSPSTVYRESATKKGLRVLASSPNKLNRFWLRVEPLDEKTIETIEKGRISGLGKLQKDVWTLDEHINVLTNLTVGMKYPEDVKTNIAEGFHWACRTGTLCEQPLRGLKAALLDVQLDGEPKNRDSTQIMRAVSRGILGSFLTCKPFLMEPVYRIEISVPTEMFGVCSDIISKRRGKVESTDQKGGLTIIVGRIPVAETLGLSAAMRSATSGRAFWQFMFDRWGRMPKKLETEVVRKLRTSKGLPAEIPRPETFVDEVFR